MVCSQVQLPELPPKRPFFHFGLGGGGAGGSWWGAAAAPATRSSPPSSAAAAAAEADAHDGAGAPPPAPPPVLMSSSASVASYAGSLQLGSPDADVLAALGVVADDPDEVWRSRRDAADELATSPVPNVAVTRACIQTLPVPQPSRRI